MHASVADWFVAIHDAPEFAGKNVLEVGSFNVNGTLRGLILEMEPDSYIGVDIREGQGVDSVVTADKLVQRFGADQFDVVICTEMLEHAENWRGSIDAMKAVLSAGGYIYLTTRGPGFPPHEYPGDFWRFTVDDMRAIFADFDIVDCVSDPQAPGVFVKARKAGRVPVDLSGIEVMSMGS